MRNDVVYFEPGPRFDASRVSRRSAPLPSALAEASVVERHRCLPKHELPMAVGTPTDLYIGGAFGVVPDPLHGLI